MDSNEVALAAIALAGTIAGGMFKLLGDNTKAQNRNADSQNNVANSMQDLVKETAKGNKEAKDRNGHLAELVLESQKSVIATINAKE